MSEVPPEPVENSSEPAPAEPEKSEEPQAQAPPPEKPPLLHWPGGCVSYILAAAAIVFLVVSGWLTALLAGERQNARSAMEAHRRASAIAAESAAESALGQAIEAMAASVKPLLIAREAVAVPDDRSLQIVCEDLAKAGRYALALISNAGGTVVASTDLSLIGRPYLDLNAAGPRIEKREGRWEATHPVRHEGKLLGVVLLRSR